ncbi:MAG TPA: hypothetical protein VJV05_02315 [Pyrinomonadaceae bacterium]|nr:hypothetical protein [Pyrinomonadaceae bacterium]
MILNYSNLADSEIATLDREVGHHAGLRDVLAWASTKSSSDRHQQIVAEVVTQDEFTHDVIVPYRDVFLVYDTT